MWPERAPPFFFQSRSNLVLKEWDGHREKPRYYMMNFRNFLIKNIWEGNKSYNDSAVGI